MPLKYVHHYMGFNFSVLLSIYYADGSVAISHGGIEMGQGIHTRVSDFVLKMQFLILIGVGFELTSTSFKRRASHVRYSTISTTFNPDLKREIECELEIRI